MRSLQFGIGVAVHFVTGGSISPAEDRGLCSAPKQPPLATRQLARAPALLLQPLPPVGDPPSAPPTPTHPPAAGYLLVWGIDIIKGFSTFSALVLAFTFVFGNSVR